MRGRLSQAVLAANEALLVEKHPEAVGTYFASGYLAHLGGRDFAGHAAVERFAKTLGRAFPNLRLRVEILAETADRVVWLRTCRATHLGAFRGFRPTGSRVIWRDMVTSRFDQGLIAEEWLVTDLAEQLLRSAKRADDAGAGLAKSD